MPTPKQMEKLAAAAAVRGKAPPTRTPGRATRSRRNIGRRVLDDAAPTQDERQPSIQTQRLSEIQRHVLRVSCRRCGRTVEIQKADAVRLYGAKAVWKDVGQRLLDDTCQQRTGSHEEDGCWPSFE